MRTRQALHRLTGKVDIAGHVRAGQALWADDYLRGEVRQRLGKPRKLLRYLSWWYRRCQYYEWMSLYDASRYWRRQLDRRYEYRLWVYEKTGVWVCHWVEYQGQEIHN